MKRIERGQFNNISGETTPHQKNRVFCSAPEFVQPGDTVGIYYLPASNILLDIIPLENEDRISKNE